MTGDNLGNEFASDFDQLDRPFEVAAAPELNRLSDLPEWKQPDMDNRMQSWVEDQPYGPTGFTTPTYVDEEEWW